MSNLLLIEQYMYKTKRNFSKTLNIMLEEWDKFSIEIQKLKEIADQERINERSKRIDQEAKAEAANLKKAEVIKK